MIAAALALLSGGWAAALASAWVLPAASAVVGAVVAVLFGGDWSMALIAAAALGAAALAYRVLGWQGALAVLTAGAVLLARRSGERAGYARRDAETEQEAGRLIDRAQDAGARADARNADPEHLRDDDGWRRD